MEGSTAQVQVRFRDIFEDAAEGEGEGLEFWHFRNFIEFLDRKAVVWGKDPFESDRIRFHLVLMMLDQDTGLDDLQGFAAWLNEQVRASTTPALRFPTKQLILDIGFLEDGSETAYATIPVLMRQGSAILGNLLSLVPASEVQLLETNGRFVVPPGLIASLLEGLPRCGTLKSLFIELGLFDASTFQALGRVVPHLCLDDLKLVQYNQDEDTDRETVPVMLRALLNGELSQTPKLNLRNFYFTTIDSGCWDLLSANPHLTELTLKGPLSVNTLEQIWSALKLNRALRKLVLSDYTAHNGFGSFGEALAVNAFLTDLCFEWGRILESDLPMLLQVLRRNRTLEVLKLSGYGLTSQELQPFLETVRYHNITLGRLILPREFVQLQLQVDAALNFHTAFRSSCQVVRENATAAAANTINTTTTTGPYDDTAVFRQWWPLLGSNYPTVKATVLFCVARGRAEIVAQSLRALSSPPNNLGSVGTSTDEPKNLRKRRLSG